MMSIDDMRKRGAYQRKLISECAFSTRALRDDIQRICFDMRRATFIAQKYPDRPPRQFVIPSCDRADEYAREKRYCIYRLTSPSGKAYIGQTDNYQKRMRAHRNGTDKTCRAILNAIRYYGWESFRKERMEVGIPSSFVDFCERMYIHQCRTFSRNGYNLTTGGGAHTEMSEESKMKNRLTHLGMGHTLETRQKISAALRGRKMSSEMRAKLRAANLGRKKTPEEIAKNAAANRGRKHTLETRAKMRGRVVSAESRAKISVGLRGIKRSPETRKKMSEAKIALWKRKTVEKLRGKELF